MILKKMKNKILRWPGKTRSSLCTTSEYAKMDKSVLIYESHNEKSAAQAEFYQKTSHSPFRFLAYRDIPTLITKYNLRQKNALDYGAGTGISTQFLFSQGFKVWGVDINKEMLIQARLNCPSATFSLIENDKILNDVEFFDFIFSSFVLFEIGTEEEIIKYLNEAKRVMRQDGLFIAVTGSQELYSRNWFIWDTDYLCNVNPQSGDKVKFFLRDSEIEFTDFFWTEIDYRRFFNKAGFSILDIHYPLGSVDEPYPWKDEIKYSPFVIFIVKPN